MPDPEGRIYNVHNILDSKKCCRNSHETESVFRAFQWSMQLQYMRLLVFDRLPSGDSHFETSSPPSSYLILQMEKTLTSAATKYFAVVKTAKCQLCSASPSNWVGILQLRRPGSLCLSVGLCFSANIRDLGLLRTAVGLARRSSDQAIKTLSKNPVQKPGSVTI
jgi:hypothetical protein